MGEGSALTTSTGDTTVCTGARSLSILTGDVLISSAGVMILATGASSTSTSDTEARLRILVRGLALATEAGLDCTEGKLADLAGNPTDKLADRVGVLAMFCRYSGFVTCRLDGVESPFSRPRSLEALGGVPTCPFSLGLRVCLHP